MDAVPSPRPCLRLGALLALCVAGCAGTQPPPGPAVRELEVEGTKALKERDIKAKIVTTDTPWYEPFWPFDEPRYFDANAWQADLRRIERFYEAQGYYEAEVVDSEVKPHGKDEVDLRVKVSEGAPTHLESITFRGFESLPEEHRKRALDKLPLVKGEVFRELDWAGVKSTIQGRLRELGYAEAEVSGNATVDMATRTASVVLEAQPGRRYRFGNTFVATDARPKVNHRRVIEQAQGAVKKGQWYSESALVEAQARVFRMGVFGAVKVNRGAPDREAGTVPIVVDVSEAPFHSLRAGGGIGVESERQEGRLLTEYTDRNFFGGLRRLTLRARVGYAFIPGVLGTRKSGPVGSVSAEFEQPRFLFRDVRAQTSLTFERGLEDAYAFDSGRLKAGVIWQPRRYFSIAPSYNLEIDNLRATNLEDAVGGTAPALAFGCTDVNDTTGCTIALSYLEQLITWDRRDDVAEPRSGYFLALGLQEAGSLLLGDFTYLRLLPEARYYQSFGEEKRLTLSGRVRVGRLFPFSTDGREAQSPIVTRFYSGGDLMRGFSSRRLSPMIAQVECTPTPDLPNSDPECKNKPNEPTKVEYLPIGGEGLFEATLEARYRLTSSVVLAAFYDLGRIQTQQATLTQVKVDKDTGVSRVEELKSVFNDRDVLQHAIGVGFRYLTLVGPIRLDLAYRPPFGGGALRVFSDPALEGLVKEASDTSCFGLFGRKGTTYPGAPEGRCSFHLSIGEAF